MRVMIKRRENNHRQAGMLTGVLLAALLWGGGFLARPAAAAPVAGIPVQHLRTADGIGRKLITKSDSTRILRKPSATARVDTLLGIFRILYVFDASEDGTLAARQSDYYRVGLTPLENKQIGWVHASQVVEWNHREGAIFAPQMGRKRARIYSSYEDVRLALLNDPEVKAISEEPPGLDQLAKRGMMPLPILEVKTQIINNENYTFYKVAYLHAPAEGDGTEVLSPAEIKKRYGTLEVIFVMDATISMRPYIEAARTVVRQMGRSLAGMQDTLNVRLGLVTFRDYDLEHSNDPDYYVKKRVIDLTNNFEEFERALENVREAQVNNPGCPEAGYDGLVEGILNTKWSDKGLRVIVYIGDNSAWEQGDPQNPNRYSAELIKDHANQRRIRMLCCKIVGGCDAQGDQERHRLQMKMLAQGTGPDTRGEYLEIPNSATRLDEYSNQMIALLNKQLLLSSSLQTIAASGSTDPARLLADVDEAFRPIILRNLGTELLDPTIIPPPEFSTGWLVQSKYRQVPNALPTILFAQRDLALYQIALNTYQYFFKLEQTDVLNAAAKDLSTKLGEEFSPEETVAEVLEKKSGLPINNVGLLNVTPSSARQMDDARRASLLEYIQSKLVYLTIYCSNPGNFMTLGNSDYRITFVPMGELP